MLAAITGRFENFDRSTGNMWDNITAERFRQVEKLIKDYHTTIGGVLCALSVKMDAWARLFPKKDVGGPVKRAEFLMSDIKPGIDTIQKIEVSAPAVSGVTGKFDESVRPPSTTSPPGVTSSTQMSMSYVFLNSGSKKPSTLLPPK